jgi:hypothetical protein
MIEWHARVGCIWVPCQKPSRQSLVLANEMQGVLDLCLGDVVGEGYIEVEGPRGGERVVHEGGVDLGYPPKTELPGLGFG